MSNELKIVLAGFGGQGVLFTGKIIAQAGLIEGKEVSWLPSYGPEMRGGTANCSVTLSDETIGSPLVLEPDVVIAMNQPSFDKYLESVRAGGTIIADSSLVKSLHYREGITVYPVPATALAEKSELAGLANMVLLGKLLQVTGFCDEVSLSKAMSMSIPARKAAMFAKNNQAIKLGFEK